MLNMADMPQNGNIEALCRLPEMFGIALNGMLHREFYVCFMQQRGPVLASQALTSCQARAAGVEAALITEADTRLRQDAIFKCDRL